MYDGTSSQWRTDGTCADDPDDSYLNVVSARI
jgi:hypothetical protein